MRIIGVALQHDHFVGKFEIQCVDQRDRAAFARIVTALDNGIAEQIPGTELQPYADRLGQIILRMVQRQLEVGQSQHAPPTSRSVGSLSETCPRHDRRY